MNDELSTLSLTARERSHLRNIVWNEYDRCQRKIDQTVLKGMGAAKSILLDSMVVNGALLRKLRDPMPWEAGDA